MGEIRKLQEELVSIRTKLCESIVKEKLSRDTVEDVIETLEHTLKRYDGRLNAIGIQPYIDELHKAIALLRCYIFNVGELTTSIKSLEYHIEDFLEK